MVKNIAFLKCLFYDILAFNVYRLPLAAFVDCNGIFEKAFSIAILIYPFVLKPYVARLKFHNAW